MRNTLRDGEALGDVDRAGSKGTRMTKAFETLAQVIFFVDNLGASKTDLDSHRGALVDG